MAKHKSSHESGHMESAIERAGKAIVKGISEANRRQNEAPGLTGFRLKVGPGFSLKIEKEPTRKAT